MASLNNSWYLTCIELDCANGFIGDLYANEGDANGRGIELYVLDGGAPADMSGMSVYLAWGHEMGGEGLTEFSPVDAARGRWRVLFPTSMQRRGTALARILVYLDGSAITGSKNFRIRIEADPVDGSTALSDNDFTVFQQAVVDLNSALERFSSQYAEAEKARNTSYSSAEKGRDNAFASSEASRAKNEQTRQTTFATLKKDAESATKDANTAAGKANGAASAANGAAERADASASEATRAASSANTAANGANEAAGKANTAASTANTAAGNANASSGRADASANAANTAASTARNLVAAAVQQLANSGGAGKEAESIEIIAKMLRNDYGCFWLAGTVWTKAAETTWAASTLTLTCATYSNGTMTLA